MTCDCGNLPLHWAAREAINAAMQHPIAFADAWNTFMERFPSYEEALLAVDHWVDAVLEYLVVPADAMIILPIVDGADRDRQLRTLNFGVRLTAAKLNKDNEFFDALLDSIDPDDMTLALTGVLYTTAAILRRHIKVGYAYPEAEEFRA